MKIILERSSGEYGFEARDELNHTVQTDAGSETGGSNSGFRPMQLLLAALGSCSAIDIVSILKKQKQRADSFTIEIEGEREKDRVPSLWKNITVKFYLEGNLENEKVERAVALSIEKYCSVAETLRRSGTHIKWETIVNKKK